MRIVLHTELYILSIRKTTKEKNYIDGSYRDLKESLENIIRGNLNLTNNIIIAETTILKRENIIAYRAGYIYLIWKSI